MDRRPEQTVGRRAAEEVPRQVDTLAPIRDFALAERPLPGRCPAPIPGPHMAASLVVIPVLRGAASLVVMVSNRVAMVFGNQPEKR